MSFRHYFSDASYDCEDKGMICSKAGTRRWIKNACNRARRRQDFLTEWDDVEMEEEKDDRLVCLLLVDEEAPLVEQFSQFAGVDKWYEDDEYSGVDKWYEDYEDDTWYYVDPCDDSYWIEDDADEEGMDLADGSWMKELDGEEKQKLFLEDDKNESWDEYDFWEAMQESLIQLPTLEEWHKRKGA